MITAAVPFRTTHARLTVVFAAFAAACTPPPAPAIPHSPTPTAPEAVPPPSRATVTEASLERPPRCPLLEVEPLAVAESPDDPPPVAIVAPERLASFYRKAAAVMRGTASDHVRIAVYGDSNHTMDFITGQLRRTLQIRYGDAGHGFVAAGKPWSHYRHMDVAHGVSGFHSFAVTTAPIRDAMYGLSGITSSSKYPGAYAWFATAAEEAPIGRAVSRFDIFYLRQPKAGAITVRVDGEDLRTIDTRNGEVELGFERVEVPDGPHRLELVASDTRSVRLLGVALERHQAKPSFIVDSFGVGALNSRAHANEHAGINHAMLQRRGYDLIVFMTGGNDVFTLDETPRHMKELIARQRAALPDTPILVVSPPDRGKRKSFEPTVRAAEQRALIAEENQTAFWDLFAAMGGRNSMASFGRRDLATNDYIHFNEAGGGWVGDRLAVALWHGLADHLSSHPDTGCPSSGDVARK